MAETSYLWDNPGTGDSPALGYGNDTLNQVIFRMLLNGTGDQGVLQGWLNELEVTDGGVDTATVDTGGAILYGVWYETDDTVDIDINAYRGGNCLIIVRASWATQTARIVARAVGALTQTAGVTYEIPLANVAINGAGAITLVTDTRDYCEFSTEVWPFGVSSAMVQTDAATIAKMADQYRWFIKGSGSLAPDGANPATWTALTIAPRRNDWVFADAVTDAVWITFRVPEDITSATISIRVWCMPISVVSGDARWLYNIWQAAASGVAANSTGNTVQTLTTPTATAQWQEHTIVDQAVTAGDLVHLQLSRDGGHAADTIVSDIALHGIYCYYTADS